MKAVILAAGMGTRLGALTNNLPKCLLKINDRPILDHLLSAMNKGGISETIVVAGYMAHKIEEFCGIRCRVITNREYEVTNNIYSLWLAKELLYGHSFMILNSDVIYDEDLLIDFICNPKDTACLVDNTVEFKEGEFHVLIKDGRVVEYSKRVGSEESGGESAQLVKIGQKDSKLYLDRIERIIQDGGMLHYHIEAYPVLFERSNLWPIFTNGRKWFEIDTVQDYENCQGFSASARPRQER